MDYEKHENFIMKRLLKIMKKVLQLREAARRII